jgi:hypothetical protein
MDDMLWSTSRKTTAWQKPLSVLRSMWTHSETYEVNKSVIDKGALKLNMKIRKNIFWLFKSGSTNIVRTGATV